MPSRNPALEAAILVDPDDTQPYLVYADWLQAQGDPRGELIVLQHALAQRSTQDLQDKVRAHMETYAADLLGPLTEFPLNARRNKTYKPTWRCGFLDKLAIGWGMGSRMKPEDATRELAAILTHPSAQFITSLELGPAPSDHNMDLQVLVDALVSTKQPAALRELVLGEIDYWDISGTATGNFGSLCPLSPRLRAVTLHGGEVTIGEVELPELQRFAVQTGQLSKQAMADICAARWPMLEHLEIWFGNPDYGAECELEDVMPLLATTHLPRLKHLGLMNCPWADDIAEALPDAAILAQLESLDLSMGALSDEGVAAMAARSEAFANLVTLNIDDNALTEASLPGLGTLSKQAPTLGEQDPDRAENERNARYCSVGE